MGACECAPSTSRIPGPDKGTGQAPKLAGGRAALTRGCLIFDYCRLGLGSVRTTRAGLPAATE